jgi:RHS repeat-associated protein
VLTDGSHTYAYDAEGRSVTIDGVGLTYDAVLRMVEQNRSGTYTEIVYSPGSAKLALMSGTGGQTLQKAFVPLPGQSTAVYTSSGLDHYRHSDWLGSARLTSSPTRTVLSTTAYAPFGESYTQSGTADLSFTGENPDTASGDYDFLFREYSNQGRWPSPDPAGVGAANPMNPQSWNRYAYVLNDPLILVDPLGLDTCYVVSYDPFEVVCIPTFVDSVTVNGVADFFDADGGGDTANWPCGGFVSKQCGPPPKRPSGNTSGNSNRPNSPASPDEKAKKDFLECDKRARDAAGSMMPGAQDAAATGVSVLINMLFPGAKWANVARGVGVAQGSKLLVKSQVYGAVFNACIYEKTGVVLVPGG